MKSSDHNIDLNLMDFLSIMSYNFPFLFCSNLTTYKIKGPITEKLASCQWWRQGGNDEFEMDDLDVPTTPERKIDTYGVYDRRSGGTYLH